MLAHGLHQLGPQVNQTLKAQVKGILGSNWTTIECDAKISDHETGGHDDFENKICKTVGIDGRSPVPVHGLWW